MLLAQRGDVRVIGLTGSGNAPFVESLGCYDQIATYDQIDNLDSSRATVSVDMAGNGSTLAGLHNHFADNLKYSCLVGATHWDHRSGAKEMAGPKPELFFAPSHIQNTDWGPGGLEASFTKAWNNMIDQVTGLIHVERASAPEQIEAIYQKQLAGEATPDVGYVLSVKLPDPA